MNAFLWSGEGSGEVGYTEASENSGQKGRKVFSSGVQPLASRAWAPVEPGRHSCSPLRNPNGLVSLSLWKTMTLEHMCWDSQPARPSVPFLVVSGAAGWWLPGHLGSRRGCWHSPWPPAPRETASDALGWWHLTDTQRACQDGLAPITSAFSEDRRGNKRKSQGLPSTKSVHGRLNLYCRSAFFSRPRNFTLRIPTRGSFT